MLSYESARRGGFANVSPEIRLAGHPQGVAGRFLRLHLCAEKRPAYSAQPASAAVLSPTSVNVSGPAEASPGPSDDSGSGRRAVVQPDCWWKPPVPYSP